MIKPLFGVLLAAAIAIAPLYASGRDVTGEFYDAIRAGNAGAIRELLKSGADVNVKDARGRSPLHYSAAVGSLETMRILVEAGADVNAHTAFGATPLMWSTADAGKVRLLIEKGADVNARSSLGHTPLEIAAAQAGNLEILRLLVNHAASIEKARNETGQGPLWRAVHTNDLDMVRFLIEKGEDVRPSDLGGSAPLAGAAQEGNPAMLKLLLSKGADVNLQSAPQFGRLVKHGPLTIGRLSPLMLAVTSANPEAVRILLDAEADVNAKDVRGMTPLMLAVATDHAGPEIVRMLLSKQADPTAESKSGETALIWAGKFRSPAILRQLGPVSSASGVPPAMAPRSRGDAAPDRREAAKSSLALMQKTSASFFQEGGCVSCHAQHITAMAVAVARANGIPVDEAAAADVLRATRLEFAARADQFFEREDGPADIILTAALLALAFADVPPDQMTDAMWRNIASQQRPGGYWPATLVMRPPTSDGGITSTASAIRVLRQYAPPALEDEMQRRTARATAWIVSAEASTTQDSVMQLLGAKWGGANAATLQRLAAKLLALQRENGGWAQTPYLPPDAYATGTALYALKDAGTISSAGAAYRRGIQYLLATRAADGSWHVASRAPKFQPYFESGFPYGNDQWISQWGTGWATIALSLAGPRLAVSGDGGRDN